jgi:hypothetical protein
VIKFNPNWTEEGEHDGADSYGSNESEDEDWQDVDDDDDDDAELMESIEAVAFTDEYRTGDAEHFSYFDTSDVEHTYASTPDGSPRKRNREF